MFRIPFKLITSTEISVKHNHWRDEVQNGLCFYMWLCFSSASEVDSQNLLKDLLPDFMYGGKLVIRVGIIIHDS